MAWEGPRAWWSQGYTAPLFIAALARPGHGYFSDEHGSSFDGSWEVRVAPDGTAYTYCSDNHPVSGGVLLLKEIPRRSPKDRKP